MTHDGRIDPQPVTLDVVPVTMIEDDTRRDALAAANGRDLVQERVTQVVRFLAVVVALLAVVRMLCGCSPATLAAIGAGASTAHDVAKIGCAILEQTDGTSAQVLAATEAMRKSILEAQADAAKQRGADAATIDALVRSVALLSETVRVNAAKVLDASGNGPAKLTPCPVGGTPPATTAPAP